MINKTIVVGVSGGSGSGKSTFAAALCEKLEGALHICSDHYFKKELPKMISPLDGKEYPDWNHPTSIDSEQMRQDILAAAESGEYRYIVAEGAYVFCIEPLRPLMDLKYGWMPPLKCGFSAASPEMYREDRPLNSSADITSTAPGTERRKSPSPPRNTPISVSPMRRKTSTSQALIPSWNG